jgi:hypothetical protein
MDTDKTVTANFSQIMTSFRLTVDVSPADGGIVKVGQAASFSYPATYDFENGTYVNLEAIPASGYLFNGWSGDLSDNTNPTTIVIDCNKRIIASFSQVMHTLTLQVSGSGSITPTMGTYDYSEGTVVSIIATPDSGWQFDSWVGDVSNPDSVAATVTMDTDKTVTANFSQIMTIHVSWPLVGGIMGGLVLVGLLAILFVRRRAY